MAEKTGCFTKIAVGFALLVALKMCSRALSSDKPSEAPTPVAGYTVQPQAAAAPEPAVKLTELKAATLLRAYSSNEVAADANYKGKRFRVSGTVAAVKTDILGDAQAYLGSEIEPVIMNGLTKSFAATLDKGDTVTAACTVSGSILGITSLDCSGPQ